MQTSSSAAFSGRIKLHAQVGLNVERVGVGSGLPEFHVKTAERGDHSAVIGT